MNAGKHHSIKTEFKKGMKPWNANKNVEIICQYCQSSFNVPVYRKYTAKFCKLVCKQKGLKIDPWKNKPERTHTAESRAKISEYQRENPMRGELNWNWKGGYGTERNQEMGRVEYKDWRQAIFVRDDFTCQICDIHGGHLHADHIKQWADYPELRYDVDNGRTVCRVCHYYITFKRKMPLDSSWGLTTARKGL